MDSAFLQNIQKKYNLPNFRINQMQKAFFEQNISSYDKISTLSKSLRLQLANEKILSFSVHHLAASQDKNAYKAILRLHDNRLIETVLLNPKPGLWSCCISSQAGCALACTFCATGKLGFMRHLTSEEITDQVLFWRFFIEDKNLKAHLSNVVYMGMGEPLHNKQEVFASIDELTNPKTFRIGARHISVSTSGLVPAMYEFTDKFSQVNLAISLHAATDEERLKMMPINKAHPLRDLIQVVNYYLNKNNRKVFMEYILLKNENDRLQDAENLVKLYKNIEKKHLVHTNLIVYNQIDSHHCESSKAKAREFKEYLQTHGISVTIRKNLGRDIDGACGQLALKEMNTNPHIGRVDTP
ncbi:23S rRNA (adenine(2503)-C(2))-methyltransferase RlmN [Candidatus Uabimicrobium sp. HlEnr_7]|uniref:23S rRNA (adenine(2503)-C(2))-methyltransferase RlmN n=1 Tax=Candidatus Uabimicrobium helgolandensis TaxID=3095367 RepID=UPI003558153F